MSFALSRIGQSDDKQTSKIEPQEVNGEDRLESLFVHLLNVLLTRVRPNDIYGIFQSQNVFTVSVLLN